MTRDLFQPVITCNACRHEADIDLWCQDDSANPVFRCPQCGHAWRRTIANSTWKRYRVNGRERFIPDHVELEVMK